MPPAWQVAAQLIHISALRTAPPHTSQEQLLLFQRLITDGEGFQNNPPTYTPAPSSPVCSSLSLWLTVSVFLHFSVLFFFQVDLFPSLPPPSVSTAVLLFSPHSPAASLPAPNSTVQSKSITPKPLTRSAIHGMPSYITILL